MLLNCAYAKHVEASEAEFNNGFSYRECCAANRIHNDEMKSQWMSVELITHIQRDRETELLRAFVHTFLTYMHCMDAFSLIRSDHLNHTYHIDKFGNLGRCHNYDQNRCCVFSLSLSIHTILCLWVCTFLFLFCKSIDESSMNIIANTLLELFFGLFAWIWKIDARKLLRYCCGNERSAYSLSCWETHWHLCRLLYTSSTRFDIWCTKIQLNALNCIRENAVACSIREL